MSKKIHKVTFDYGDGWEYSYLECMDPENMNTERKYASSGDWEKVTCLRCIKRGGHLDGEAKRCNGLLKK
jgi:hypothetical protein